MSGKNAPTALDLQDEIEALLARGYHLDQAVAMANTVLNNVKTTTSSAAVVRLVREEAAPKVAKPKQLARVESFRQQGTAVVAAQPGSPRQPPQSSPGQHRQLGGRTASFSQGSSVMSPLPVSSSGPPVSPRQLGARTASFSQGSSAAGMGSPMSPPQSSPGQHRQLGGRTASFSQGSSAMSPPPVSSSGGANSSLSSYSRKESFRQPLPHESPSNITRRESFQLTRQNLQQQEQVKDRELRKVQSFRHGPEDPPPAYTDTLAAPPPASIFRKDSFRGNHIPGAPNPEEPKALRQVQSFRLGPESSAENYAKLTNTKNALSPSKPKQVIRRVGSMKMDSIPTGAFPGFLSSPRVGNEATENVVVSQNVTAGVNGSANCNNTNGSGVISQSTKDSNPDAMWAAYLQKKNSVSNLNSISEDYGDIEDDGAPASRHLSTDDSNNNNSSSNGVHSPRWRPPHAGLKVNTGTTGGIGGGGGGGRGGGDNNTGVGTRSGRTARGGGVPVLDGDFHYEMTPQLQLEVEIIMRRGLYTYEQAVHMQRKRLLAERNAEESIRGYEMQVEQQEVARSPSTAAQVAAEASISRHKRTDSDSSDSYGAPLSDVSVDSPPQGQIVAVPPLLLRKESSGTMTAGGVSRSGRTGTTTILRKDSLGNMSNGMQATPSLMRKDSPVNLNGLATANIGGGTGVVPSLIRKDSTGTMNNGMTAAPTILRKDSLGNINNSNKLGTSKANSASSSTSPTSSSAVNKEVASKIEQPPSVATTTAQHRQQMPAKSPSGRTIQKLSKHYGESDDLDDLFTPGFSSPSIKEGQTVAPRAEVEVPADVRARMERVSSGKNQTMPPNPASGAGAAAAASTASSSVKSSSTSASVNRYRGNSTGSGSSSGASGQQGRASKQEEHEPEPLPPPPSYDAVMSSYRQYPSAPPATRQQQQKAALGGGGSGRWSREPSPSSSGRPALNNSTGSMLYNRKDQVSPLRNHNNSSSGTLEHSTSQQHLPAHFRTTQHKSFLDSIVERVGSFSDRSESFRSVVTTVTTMTDQAIVPENHYSNNNTPSSPPPPTETKVPFPNQNNS